MRVKISFLLVLILVLSGVQVYSKSNNSNLSKDLYLIEQLGIMSNPSENQENGVSRAEFLSWALKMSKVQIEPVKTEPIFNDVTMGHVYADEIQTAYDLNFVTGDGNGRFRPDDCITSYEAAVILINSMGYKSIANGAYGELISAMKLYDNFSFNKRNDILVRENAAIMIYNALNTPTAKIKNQQYSSKDKDDETYLELMWGIYDCTGIVTQNEYVSSVGKNPRPNTAYIDDEKFDETAYSVDGMLGMQVKVYYTDDYSEKSIVYAYPLSRNTVSKPAGFDYEGYSDYEFKFLKDSSKREKYKINNKTCIIYNNRLLHGNEFERVFNDKAAEFTFIENDSDKIYDFVIIKIAEVYVPTVIDAQRLFISGKDRDSISLDDYTSYSVTDTEGEAVEISDVKLTDVLLVYEPGIKNAHLEITVITDYKELEVSGTDEDDETVTLSDNQEYSVYEKAYTPFSELKIGTEYSFYFDASGRIVYAVAGRHNHEEPMYIIDASHYKTDREYEIKALNIDGDIQYYTLANKVKFRDKNGNESTIEPDAVVQNLTNNNVTERQLILTKVNSKKEIRSIKTLSKDKADDFYMPEVSDHNAYRWYVTQYSLENLIQLKASTKLFVVPYTDIKSPEDEYFYTGDIGIFINDKAYPNRSWYPGSGYGFKPVMLESGKFAADYLILECPEDTKFTTGASAYGLITSMINAYDEERDEACKKITLFGTTGGEQEFLYIPTKDESIIDVGDIVEVTYTTQRIKDDNIKMYYDKSEDKFEYVTNLDTTSGWRYYAGFRVTKGKVSDTDDGIALCNTMTTAGSYQNEYIKYTGAKILKLGKKKKELFDYQYLKEGLEYTAVMSGGQFKLVILYED